MHTELISFKKELKGIDTFRGIAALMVFAYHFWAFALYGKTVSVFGIDITPIFQAGYRGVDIFFVLSGFLLFYSLYHSKNGLKEYYFRRLRRIIPLYYFSLFIIVIFKEPQLLTTLSGISNITKHLTFIQAFWENSSHTINQVDWTLSLEMFFYLMLPFLFWLSGRKWWRTLLVVASMATISFAYRNYVFHNFYGIWNEKQQLLFTEQLPGRLDQFAVGILTSFAFIKTSKILHGRTAQSIFLAVFFASAIAFYYLLGVSAKMGIGVRDVEWIQAFFGTITAATFAVGLFALLHTFSLVQNIFSNRFFGFFGLISYGVYLWHYKIIESFNDFELALSIKFLLSFGITIALSSVTYFLIELPFLKKR